MTGDVESGQLVSFKKSIDSYVFKKDSDVLCNEGRTFILRICQVIQRCNSELRRLDPQNISFFLHGKQFYNRQMTVYLKIIVHSIAKTYLSNNFTCQYKF